jgi:hypothetical protein
MVAMALASSPGAAWDAAPNEFLVRDPASTVASAQAAAAAGKLAFDEGSPLKLGCYYAYQSGIDVPPPWRVAFSVDGESLGSVPAHPPKIGNYTSSEEYVSVSPADPGIKSETSTTQKLVVETYYAEVPWIASGAGPRTVQCVLNPDKAAGESNVHNNVAQQVVEVKRLAALTPGELPVPNLASPVGGPAFTLGPALAIEFAASVPPLDVAGKADVGAYAKASSYDERWHVEIVRRNPGARGSFEPALGEVSGPLESLAFTARIDHAWLQQHGADAGSYTARAYLSQDADGHAIAGRDARVDFELRNPATASTALHTASEPVAPSEPARVPAIADARTTARAPAGLGATRAAPPEGAGPVRVPVVEQSTVPDIEAEALAGAGRVEVSGGGAHVQAMQPFGAGWSGAQQVLWTGGAEGAVLDLVVDVAAAGQYAVEIYLTRAPDYAQVRFEVDGRAGVTTFDGMAPTVAPSGPVQLGKFPLQAGPRRVSLMIVGRHPQSTGYLVGIDKLRFYAAGPID